MSVARIAVLRALLVTTCLTPGAAFAQAEAQAPAEETSIEEIVVTGEITYRNRTDTVAPELVYDQRFFEQFEPLSVGDQLSRVPGVAFTSDIGERDAPQLRGLGEGFTQVLVNGRPIPGAGNDRTVFVDRIPAEIIDRIEIVRAPSANIDSQGIGGTINIILKDGASLPPGVIARVGVINNVDNEVTRGLGAVSLSGRTDDRRIAYSGTIDYQSRYNVKVLDQQLFDDTSPGFNPASNGLDLFQPDAFNPAAPSTLAVEHEDQIDTRDSRDLSFNGDLTLQMLEGHSLRFDGFYLNTEREETESAQLFVRSDDPGDGGNDNGDVSDEPWALDEVASQQQDIKQTSYGVSLLYEGQLTEALSFESQARYSRFQEDNTETDFVDDPPEPDSQIVIDSDDQEVLVDGALILNSDELAQRMRLAEFEFEVGVVGKVKTRDFSQREFEDDNGDGDFDDPDDEVTPGSGVFNFEERRLDAYLQAELHFTESVTFQAGVRFENTETETSLPDGTSGGSETSEVNPSMHLQWDVGQNGQVRASVARTIRRPTLDQLVPFENEESPGDEDVTIGNPNLGLESAWGVDIGYEHRIGNRGIIGVNFFRREVSDLISLVSTGLPSGAGGFIYTYQNIGDGIVSGYEIDISTPLGFIGLEETGFFANFTELDSERTDPLTGIVSTFNAQPDYVYNYGLTQNLPSWDASFGFSYRKQGMSRSLFLGEIEDQWYDANLEIFIEKRFGDHFVARLVGNNLLDADSIQAEKNFDGDSAEQLRDAMLANDVDEFELERENSSPTVMLTLRAVF
jgi:outer membrane receptor protein involved in Fe transport